MVAAASSAPALKVLAPGVRLGRFTLLQRLAVGGMAELHLAKQDGIEGFEKLVVIKRVLPHLAEDPDFIRMFINEARLAATLDHPNIAAVHDIGLEAGEHFFAMEYVHGRNLLEVLKQAGSDKMPIDAALTIVTGVAAGLHHAHEHMGLDGRPMGIVHRDVSPSNVMIAHAGAVKLTDFGIAKAVERTSTTLMGQLKGKVGYMSPEQCRCENVDRRSDVFGLGILLYEVTTGVRAFYAPNDFAIMATIARGDVTPPSEHDEDYPEELEEIVMKALAADPADRFATAEAFQLAVEAYAQRHALVLSTTSVARYMRSVFGSVPAPSTSVIAAVPFPDEPAALLEPKPVTGPRFGRVLLGGGLMLTGGALGALLMTTAAEPRAEDAASPTASTPAAAAASPAPRRPETPSVSVAESVPAPEAEPEPEPVVEAEPPAEPEAVDEQPTKKKARRSKSHGRKRKPKSKSKPRPEPPKDDTSDRNALYPPGHAP